MNEVTELVPARQEAIQLGTLVADTPAQLVKGAEAISRPLAQIVERQKLYSMIQGRKYVRLEGWLTMASMLGVVPTVIDVHELDEPPGVFNATVALIRMADGREICRAQAECGEERPWNNRSRFARKSMAQSRATGKACRTAFSWIMSLSGFEGTPFEEMPETHNGESTPPAFMDGPDVPPAFMDGPDVPPEIATPKLVMAWDPFPVGTEVTELLAEKDGKETVRSYAKAIKTRHPKDYRDLCMWMKAHVNGK